MLVSGASRGIGRAIAIKLAESGSDLVLCGRTVEAHSKLPGTLMETAAEVTARGGTPLVVEMDVTDDAQVVAAVEKCMERFGRLDAVVCNAGALFIAPMAATPMKRFDLVHKVNLRGTYTLIQAALPHLAQSENPHILTISPPISLKPKWLANTTAYTLSKYGLSMLVIGLSAELAPQGIAANALWPATTIDTAAVRFNVALGGDKMAERSRRPEIVGDAAEVMLSQDASRFTGNFMTDEQALEMAGVTDLAHYSVTVGSDLQPDFYID